MSLSLLLLSLLSTPAYPQPSPSHWLDYSISSTTLSLVCRTAKAKAQDRLARLGALPAERADFAAAVRGFWEAMSDLNDETAGPMFLGEVSTDQAVRDAGSACDTDISRWNVEVYSREDLYKALKAAAAKGEKREGEDARLLEKTLLAFKRTGLELPAAQRAKVRELKQRIVEVENKFRKVLGEEKATLSFTKEQLAGMPADFVARLPRDEALYKVSLDYPDYFPFMDNAKDPEARRLLEARFNMRGGESNTRLLSEVLALRRETAKLLGYPSHAHYVLEDRMAKTPEAALTFLTSLRAKLKAKADPELKDLAALKDAELGSRSDHRVRAWDWRYYHNRLMKERYQVDDQKIKEYFPVDVVTTGMLDVYQRLLGLRYREVKPAGAWHPEVQLFEVLDASDGRLLAHFYMDLFPRDGKYKHAAAFTLVQGRRLPDGSYQRPVSAMVANFNKPTAQAPSLMTHSEVETYFHEFGHIMHQVLTTARYQRFSGTSVARDFVEAPSQMLENWTWNGKILQSLSGHHKDRSKKLPDDILARMLAAKNVDSGLKYLRQAFFATYDLTAHMTEAQDPNVLYAKLMEEVSLIPMSPGTRPEAGFGHLMGGYDSAYYGYLWSEVFAQDMFSRFEKEGLLSPVVGLDYRRKILEPGGSIEEGVSLRAFLGREPGDEAFLKSIGLETPSGAKPGAAAPRER